jgi:hypothetical protein
MKRVVKILAVLAVLMTFSSCNQVPRGFDEAEQKAVIPNYFLLTGYEPMNEWLDTPYQVLLRKVSMEEALNTWPLNDIRYRIEHYPSGDDLEWFSLNSPGMTRRQLLWGIARHFGVSMHIEYIHNLPSAIVITERI